MKKSDKAKLELVGIFVIIPVIFSMVVFSNDIFAGISLFVYAKMVPYDIVFDPSVDKSDIDASQIINCLHGGGCPAGISYINDETGLKEEREIIPNRSQPIPNYAPEAYANNVPYSLQTSVKNADVFIYVTYGIIMISLVIIGIILIKRRMKK